MSEKQPENKNKPPGGYGVENDGYGHWLCRGPGWAPDYYFDTEESAIAACWEQHDGQQGEVTE